MDSVLEFLANNYIIILIITGVLIFSLIGFLTDTSKNKLVSNGAEVKTEKPKKEKKKKKEEVVESGPTIGELMKQKQEQEKQQEVENTPKVDEQIKPEVQQPVSLEMPAIKTNSAEDKTEIKK